MMQEISATEAAQLLETEPATTVLLDVREHPELATASVAGATHIPMGETPQRLAELNQDKTIICMCHLGGRSAQVAGYLHSQGYTKVLNLTGGIQAWSHEVDQSIPRY
jgi:rhodanese-related sulfurtransferase